MRYDGSRIRGTGSERQYALIILSSACVGASYSIFYSSVFLKISDLSRDDQENTALVTFTTAGMFFGQTISVYLLQAAEAVFHMEGYRFRFLFLGGALFLAAAICVICCFLKHPWVWRNGALRRSMDDRQDYLFKISGQLLRRLF